MSREKEAELRQHYRMCVKECKKLAVKAILRTSRAKKAEALFVLMPEVIGLDEEIQGKKTLNETLSLVAHADLIRSKLKGF